MIHPATYECDKCHAVQATDSQFWEVGIKCNHLNYTNNDFVDETFRMQVCRPCLEAFGIHVQARKRDEVPLPPPPTLEDLIRELVAREVEMRGRWQD